MIFRKSDAGSGTCAATGARDAGFPIALMPLLVASALSGNAAWADTGSRSAPRALGPAASAEEVGAGTSRSVSVDGDLRMIMSSAGGALAFGDEADAAGADSTALGNAARATAPNSVALGRHSVADRENTVSVGSPDARRTVSNVATGMAADDAVNVRQLNVNLAQAQRTSVATARRYTDQQVGEIRGDIGRIRGEIRQMDRSFRKGIASVAALQMTTPYAPGRVAVNAGAALYRGQAAAAVGVSYWNTAGDFNVNAGVATAGSSSTVVRGGVGYLF